MENSGGIKVDKNCFSDLVFRDNIVNSWFLIIGSPKYLTEEVTSFQRNQASGL